MATDSNSKLTKFESTKTIVTADFANSLYGGLFGTTEGDLLSSDDPKVYGHIHDGVRADGHASKIDLVDHVSNQLRNINLADQAVTKRNVARFKNQDSAIPVSEVIDGETYYYLDIAAEANTASNVGDGSQIFKEKVDEDLRFRTLTAGTGINLSDSLNEISITNDGVLGASNLGAGEGLFTSVLANNVQLKTLTAGPNISLSSTATEIQIESAGGGAFTNDTSGATNLVRQDVSGVGNYASDDFVFGSPSLDDTGSASNDNRIIFDKSKGSFHAGSASLTQWDNASRGLGNAVFGADNQVSSNFGGLFGSNNVIANDYALGFGDSNEISGNSTYGMAKGNFGFSYMWSQNSHSIGQFDVGPELGQAQTSVLVARGEIPQEGIATNIYLDGSSQIFNVRQTRGVVAKVTWVIRKDAPGLGGIKVAAGEHTALLIREAAAASVDSSSTTITTLSSSFTGTVTVNFVPNGVTGDMGLQFTLSAFEDIPARVVCRIEWTEVYFDSP